MKSDSSTVKGNQSIPAVVDSPSRSTAGNPTGALRKQSNMLDTNQNLDINDEIHLCRVRATERHCMTPDSASQRVHVAGLYHISPHRLTMSPRLNSDSWQEASTEPLVTPKTKSPVRDAYATVPDETINNIATTRIYPLSSKRKLDDVQQQLPTKILRQVKSQEYLDMKKKTTMVDQDMDGTNSDSWQEVSTEPLQMTPSKNKSPLREEEYSNYPTAPKLVETPNGQEQQEIKIELDKMSIDCTKTEKPKVVDEQDKDVDTEKKKEDSMGPLSSSNTNEKPSKEEEEARIAKEIDHLMTTVRGLPNYYQIIDKIGEGTFSTVYKAQDLRRDLYSNEEWEPGLLNSASHPYVSPTSTPTRETSVSPSPSNSKALNEFVALKRIYHTSSPKRIANEIGILRKLKGSKCISPLITAFRQQHQVFIVMPYFQHDDFRKTYYDMSMLDIKYYMKSLFTALEHLHKHKILHRDVKPNNFLYNCRKRTGYLIDFGLAETEDDSKMLEETVQKQAQTSKYNIFAQLNNSNNSNNSANKSGSAAVISSHSVLVQLTNKENRAGSTTVPSLTSLVPTTAPCTSSATTKTKPTSISASKAISTATSKATSLSIGGPGRVPGYIRNDPRNVIRANRAGTRGFRAPEVLLRITYQTCAVDIWSAGVVLLCFMTGRFPFFLANDESDALVELTQIFGYKEMKKAAEKYNRNFTTNIFVPSNRHPWSKLCEVLHKERIATWDPLDYQNALDLLNRCLDLDNTTRITAAEAVEHDFLKLLN